MRTPAKALRDLPVLWKILVPFMALMVLLGWAGTFIIVRNLSSRAGTALDQDLSRQMLDVRASVQARELYLLEAANLTANLRGMAEAVRRRDATSATRLMRSVLALKRDLRLLAVIDASGSPLVGFVGEGDQPLKAAAPEAWKDALTVRPRSDEAAGAGIASIGETPMVLIATPICSGTDRCDLAGVVLAGIDTGRLSLESFMNTASKDTDGGGIALYDPNGTVVASAGRDIPPRLNPATVTATKVRRITRSSAAGEVVTLAAPLQMQGTRIGFASVSLPKGPALAAVRGTGYRLASILLAAMFGVVVLGALLSRFILAQVRPLVLTNRALEQGVLSARTPVLGDDELGELARGINRMAESLQDSHETLESRVEERTREIHRLLQERSDFFAALSHELRTPLAVILAKSEMLLAPVIGSTDGRVRDFTATIHRSADQVLSVVNEILDLAKAEAGHLEVALEDVSLTEELDNLQGTIDGLVTAAGLTLSVEVPLDLPSLRADRAHLRKMLLNLMDNASKYTPAGGRVTIKAVARGDAVDVSVADTGAGIPPRAREHIFDPFYRVPGTRTQRGQAATGLGLALTKRLAEAQGGTIGFTSRHGRGSTFTISLSRAQPLETSTPRVTSASR